MSAWRRDARRWASGPLLDGIERLGRRAGKMWVNLLGVATHHPSARLVPAFLERISELNPVELRFTLLGGHVPAYQSTLPLGMLTCCTTSVLLARTIAGPLSSDAQIR